MSRIVYLDIVKVIAIIFVMMCHIPRLWSVDMLADSANIFWIVNQAFGTMGVPLFMMATGALVLNKTFEKKEDIIRFYRKNFLTIYITGALWCVIFYFLNPEELSVKDLLKTICLINKSAVHLWYIRMILLYYLIMPLLSWLVHKQKWLFVAVVAVVTLITFVYNGYDMFVNNNVCPTKSGVSMACYLVYLACGYYIAKGKLRINLAFAAIMAFVGLIALAETGCVGICKFFWYDNPFALIASVGIFAMIKSMISKGMQSACLSPLSSMTFGVYLCHMLFVTYLGGWIVGNIHLSAGILYICILILSFMLSFALVYIVHFVPKVSKILFRY